MDECIIYSAFTSFPRYSLSFFLPILTKGTRESGGRERQKQEAEHGADDDYERRKEEIRSERWHLPASPFISLLISLFFIFMFAPASASLCSLKIAHHRSSCKLNEEAREGEGEKEIKNERRKDRS